MSNIRIPRSGDHYTFTGLAPSHQEASEDGREVYIRSISVSGRVCFVITYSGEPQSSATGLSDAPLSEVLAMIEHGIWTLQVEEKN